MSRGKIFIGIMTVISMVITNALAMDELHAHKAISVSLGIFGTLVTAVIAVFGKPLAGNGDTPRLADTIPNSTNTDHPESGR